MAKKQTKKEDPVELAREITADLLKLLDVENNIEITSEGEGEELTLTIRVEVSQEAGLLIGAHGSTLNAIQSFVVMALKQKTGEWVRVILDIGDWRAKHEEHLVALAKQAVARAKSTGEPQHLYNLTPAQRRTIHMSLSEEDGIQTESQGEGEARYLVIKKTS